MKNRWLATLALATACTAPLLVHAGTTKSEWRKRWIALCPQI